MILVATNFGRIRFLMPSRFMVRDVYLISVKKAEVMNDAEWEDLACVRLLRSIRPLNVQRRADECPARQKGRPARFLHPLETLLQKSLLLRRSTLTRIPVRPRSVPAGFRSNLHTFSVRFCRRVRLSSSPAQ